MEAVISISLVNIASNEQHHLSTSEHIIGRGWLNCDDKRISRNHGILKVISSNEVVVHSTHQNSMFYKKRDDPRVKLIEKDNKDNLNGGDSFGLLVDEFWFTIQIRNNDNNTIDGQNENTVRQNGDEPSTSSANDVKRRNSSDAVPDSTSKRLRVEPNECDAASSLNENCDMDTTVAVDQANNNYEVPSTSTSSTVENNPTSAIDPVDLERPIKAEPMETSGNEAQVTSENETRVASESEAQVSSGNEVQFTSENEALVMPVPGIIKIEPVDLSYGVDSTNAAASSNVTVKTEVKPEPSDNSSNTVASSSNTAPTRECCRYGIRCYRRNPLHRAQEAHPGDQDYRLPDYPDPPLGTPPCPFLDRCYRRNPEHFRRFSHSASCKDPKGKQGYEATAKTPRRAAPTQTQTNDDGEDSDESEEDPFADNSEDMSEYEPDQSSSESDEPDVFDANTDAEADADDAS